MPEAVQVGSYDVLPFHPERNATVDTLRWARRRFGVPALLEVDVTAARAALRSQAGRTGRKPGFTAWVIHCVACAAAEHPHVHAARLGKRRVVRFRDVDVAVLIERPIGEASRSETVPAPCVIRKANEKGVGDIHDEIRRAQASHTRAGSPVARASAMQRLQSAFFRLPAWLRDLVFWRWLMRNPFRIKRTMGTVVVSATGMAAPGVLAWGIPLSIHPLAIGVGGITRRSTADGVAEVLALTVVFDHAVTDGAPVGRFIGRLDQLMTGAHGLDGLDSGRAPEAQPGATASRSASPGRPEGIT